MDLIMGCFADRFVPQFTESELDLYEDLLKESDPDLYNWISGREPLPPEMDNPVLAGLIGFQVK